MANEITITAIMKLENGHLSISEVASSKKFDQSALGGGLPGFATIGTTEETITTTDISTLGWMWMKNLDTGNYVEWGFSTGVYGGRVEAGEPALLRLNPGATIYMKADTAAVDMRIVILED